MNSVTPLGKAAAAANLKPFATVTHPVALQNDKHTNSEQQEHTQRAARTNRSPMPLLLEKNLDK